MFVTVTTCGWLTVLCACFANVRFPGVTCAVAESGVIVTDGALALVVGLVAASADGAT
jgi:hypothetical protein